MVTEAHLVPLEQPEHLVQVVHEVKVDLLEKLEAQDVLDCQE